jgi:hypothetical protein
MLPGGAMPPGKMIGRRGNTCDGSHIDGALGGKCYIKDITPIVWMAGLEKVVVGLRQFSDKGCDNRLPFFIHSEIPTSLIEVLTLSESKVINHKPFSYE